MRGIAGPTIVWLIDATSMPSMSAMKMLRVGRSSPGAFAARRRAGWCGRGVRGYPLGLLWHAGHGTPIVQ